MSIEDGFRLDSIARKDTDPALLEQRLALSTALRRRSNRFEWGLVAGLFLILLIVPLTGVGGQYLLHVLILAFIFGQLAMSVDVSIGYTGQFSVSHIAFFGIGGYTWAILTSFDVPAVPALIVAVLLAIPLGILVGFLCLRFSGAPILVVTLALTELLRTLVHTFPEVTGGAGGLFGFPSFPLVDNLQQHYYFILAILAVCAVVLGLLGRSPYGRSLVAVRENSRKAEMLGINTTRRKVAAFVISGVPAALAGVVYTEYVGVLTPEIFYSQFLLYPIAIAIIGGMGTIFGSLFGALLFFGGLQVFAVAGAVWENVALGVALILVILLKPEGLWNAVVNGFRRRQLRAASQSLPKEGA